MNQSEIEENTSNKRPARQKGCEQEMIGQFRFASDCLSNWSEKFQPITERSKAKGGLLSTVKLSKL